VPRPSKPQPPADRSGLANRPTSPDPPTSLIAPTPATAPTPPRPAADRDELLQFARGWWEPRILLTAVELDVFSRLAGPPRTAASLAADLPADLRGLTILLDALAALGLLEKRDGQYRCPPEFARFLAADRPGTIVPMLRHGAALWHRWTRLTEVVRGAPPASAARSAGDQQAFIEAMAVVSAPLAPAIVQAANPAGARALLDVGGGPGTYTRAFLAAVPMLRATLFDLPPVIEIARRHLAAAGVLERVRLVAGDFETDALPPGHDLALLSAIIHQNSPAQNVALYAKVGRALGPGGRILIRDHVLGPDRTQPRAAAVFAVNMLVGTAGGNCYTYEEIRAGLRAAGFERIRLIQAGEAMTGLVEGYKPA
jgi:predicted O-methyltransferase YrrM